MTSRLKKRKQSDFDQSNELHKFVKNETTIAQL